MIRRLRLKFVCINMAIVTLMLCAIFAMVFFFTRANLERESIGMMQALAQEPMRPGGPDERPEGVRLPFFTLELDEDGGIADAWGGYYDLTDGELLEKLLALAEAGDGEHRRAGGLRPALLPGLGARDAVHRLCGHVQRAERHR